MGGCLVAYQVGLDLKSSLCDNAHTFERVNVEQRVGREKGKQGVGCPELLAPVIGSWLQLGGATPLREKKTRRSLFEVY